MPPDPSDFVFWNEADVLADICRESYVDFVKEFWSEVPGAGALIWGKHMDVLCKEVQDGYTRVFKGLPKEHDWAVNEPPGTSKSTIFSILAQPWSWTRMPHCRHLSATHTHELALDLSAKSRWVIESDKYRTLYPEIILRKDQDSKGYFANTLGGDRLTCTVGGKSPMGFHAHILTVDDPIDPKGAISVAELMNCRHFMTNILPTRKVDKKVSVTYCVHQRLRGTLEGTGGENEDATGVMLEVAKREGTTSVRHVVLPCRLTDAVKPAELKEIYTDSLLDPERLDEAVLKDFEARLGPYGFAAQFNQDPIPLGGGMFEEKYFSLRVKAAPYDCVRRIRYWDRASTEGGGAATAGVLLARDANGRYYVEHCEHGHWEPDERNRRMRAVAQRDRTRYPTKEPEIWVEAEGGSSGRDAWKAVASALEGFRVREDKVTGNKDVRAEPWSCALAAGLVSIVDDGTWDVLGYIQEHLLFRPDPKKGQKRGKLKDRVDASDGAYNLMAGARVAGTLRSYRLGVSDKKARLVVCGYGDLPATIIDDPAVLISICEPGSDMQAPAHALNHSMGVHAMAFADVEPKDFQDSWLEIVPSFNLPPEKLVLTTETAKKMWLFLVKRKEALVYVFQDNGGEDRRAMSVALAVADSWSLPRSYIHDVAERDVPSEPQNGHVYNIVKQARNQVVE